MNKYGQNNSKSLKGDLNAKKNNRKSVKVRVPTEAEEQRVLCEWLDHHKMWDLVDKIGGANEKAA